MSRRKHEPFMATIAGREADYDYDVVAANDRVVVVDLPEPPNCGSSMRWTLGEALYDFADPNGDNSLCDFFSLSPGLRPVEFEAFVRTAYPEAYAEHLRRGGGPLVVDTTDQPTRRRGPR